MFYYSTIGSILNLSFLTGQLLLLIVVATKTGAQYSYYFSNFTFLFFFWTSFQELDIWLSRETNDQKLCSWSWSKLSSTILTHYHYEHQKKFSVGILYNFGDTGGTNAANFYRFLDGVRILFLHLNSAPQIFVFFEQRASNCNIFIWTARLK